jgi:hypothetical protein
VTNTKLVSIVRYLTRGGQINALQPNIFWLGRPRFLLHVIKFLLFFSSFIIANAIFFAGQFGGMSCFFAHNGFQGAVPFGVSSRASCVMAPRAHHSHRCMTLWLVGLTAYGMRSR